MVEEKTNPKRNKPKFLRSDWHKKIKLGKGVKKNQKWKGAKGRQNKIRLHRKGYSTRPRIGWGADSNVRGYISGLEAVRVENLKDLETAKKGQGILIANVGKKKRLEIIAKATEKKMTVLNKYKDKKEWI